MKKRFHWFELASYTGKQKSLTEILPYILDTHCIRVLSKQLLKTLTDSFLVPWKVRAEIWAGIHDSCSIRPTLTLHSIWKQHGCPGQLLSLRFHPFELSNLILPFFKVNRPQIQMELFKTHLTRQILIETKSGKKKKKAKNICC